MKSPISNSSLYGVLVRLSKGYKKRGEFMCFSATASFGASAVLSIIGTAAIIKARTIPQGLFAVIPIIFSLQQLNEGFLWLTFKDEGIADLQPFFTYTFLVFALMIWPLWMCFTNFKLEKDPKRRSALKILLILSIIVAGAAGAAMFFYPVGVVKSNHHLHYNINIAESEKKFLALFTLMYSATTIIPTFISSINRMKWFGILLLLSYAVTLYLYSEAVASVWCYFAALLSMIIYWIISGLQEAPARAGSELS